MDSYRFFNNVGKIEARYKVLGNKVSKPVAWVSLGYLGVILIAVLVWSQTDIWMPIAVVGVAGGLFLAILLILDARLRGYGLQNVWVQAKLLRRAAKEPMSKNF